MLKWRQTEAFPDLRLWCVYHIEPSNWIIKHNFITNVDSWPRCDNSPMLVAYFRSCWYSDFFNEILFRKSLFFNFLPSMARMCGCVYLSNATESTVGLSDTRQSQWKQIQATMVHFNGYTLSRSGCLVPVLLYRYVQFFSRPHSRLVCLWLLKFHPPICALLLSVSS